MVETLEYVLPRRKETAAERVALRRAVMPRHPALFPLTAADLASQVRRALNDLGWTPAQLSQKSGLDDATVTALLRDGKVAFRSARIAAEAMGYELTILPSGLLGDLT
jgi:lambda repressor-like predicted transcriptional regulator